MVKIFRSRRTPKAYRAAAAAEARRQPPPPPPAVDDAIRDDCHAAAELLQISSTA